MNGAIFFQADNTLDDSFDVQQPLESIGSFGGEYRSNYLTDDSLDGRRLSDESFDGRASDRVEMRQKKERPTPPSRSSSLFKVSLCYRNSENHERSKILSDH